MRALPLILLALASVSGPLAARSLQTVTDYPPEALRNGWQGDVVADLTVSPAGRVSACQIVESSGHKVLDDATCDLLKRAVFTPATDSNGKPIEDHVRTPPIKWRLP
jgi:protein TonB